MRIKLKLGDWRFSFWKASVGRDVHFEGLLWLENDTKRNNLPDGAVWAYRLTLRLSLSSVYLTIASQVMCRHTHEDEDCDGEGCEGGWYTQVNLSKLFPWWRWCK